jgi:hypothetical protein
MGPPQGHMSPTRNLIPYYLVIYRAFKFIDDPTADICGSNVVRSDPSTINQLI